MGFKIYEIIENQGKSDFIRDTSIQLLEVIFAEKNDFEEDFLARAAISRNRKIFANRRVTVLQVFTFDFEGNPVH